ncbi:efflux RND transporter permease subunit [bacterium]|nr:efflux RND transporter permease subunit [bacterium]
MKKAIEWMVDNHVTVNLVMLMIIFAGFISIKSANQEIFPEIPLDTITIQVVYRGATPEDIEESIVSKIEEAVSDVVGIEQITSTSSEGVGVVVAQLELGADVSVVKDRIETQVNRILTFPTDAERPIITQNIRTDNVIRIAILGELNFDEMKKLAERVKDDLTSMSTISQVSISGIKNYEISIEISEEKLKYYGLKFSDISNAIKTASLDMPAGKIKRKNEEILLRTKGLKYNADEYKNIVIKKSTSGTTLKLKDIATIKDDFEDSDLYSYFNGKPAVMIDVARTGDQKPLAISEAVYNYIESIKSELPSGVTIETWNDRSTILRARLDLMLKNAAWGFIFVLLSLTLFLDLRLALWVSSGIIISFMGGFFIMYLAGVTINMMSLFAFIVVLGIVVDDAIVVGEDVYSNRENGVPPREASKRATTRIAVPVIFAVLTTVATFSPLLFTAGNMGKIMAVIPIIVIGVLMISLFESLFILPAHLSTIKLESNTLLTKGSAIITKKVDIGLKFFINKILGPTVELAIKFKYIVLAMFILVFIVSVGLFVGGSVKFVFFPEIEGDNAVAYLTMPQGSTLENTKRIVDRILSASEKTKEEFEKKFPQHKGEIFKNIFVSIGDQPSTRRGPNANTITTSNPSVAEINIELLASEKRKFSAMEIISSWKKNIGKLAGIDNLQFQSTLMSAGDAISVNILGSDFDNLGKASEEIKEKLLSYNGVYNIKDNFNEGKLEIKFKLKESAKRLGIKLSDIAQELRYGFYGDEVLRVQRGKDEVKIRVWYPKSERDSIDNIKKMRIRTQTGVEIPLSEVSEFTIENGYSSITRVNGKKVIGVTASVDESIANADEINKDLRQYLDNVVKRKYYGISFDYEGAQKERQKSMKSLLSNFLIALFAVYVLLAIPFKSYSQPFIIMLSIPFGIVGSIIAHYFLGYHFSFMSAIGVVALSGVVVNDALVLVDYINELFSQEKNLTKKRKEELVVAAVKRRFRPILLTSLTTFLGLAPMILEKSIQAKFLIPMAISLGFGILFTTIITLYLIPIGVLISDSVISIFKKDEKNEEVLDEIQC